MSLTARIVSALLAAVVVAIILKLQRRGGMVSKYGLLWTVTSALLLMLAAAPDVADSVGGWLGGGLHPVAGVHGRPRLCSDRAGAVLMGAQPL